MAEAARITVLVNSTSGKGRGSTAAKTAIARLRELGADVRVRTGDSPESSRVHAAEAVAEGVDALVVVGGDGTLSKILDEVSHSGVPIAIVPAGTGNDFARSLGIPHQGAASAAEAAEVALFGEVRNLDVAVAACPERTVKFLTIAALGFDAMVNERTNNMRWPKGAARYYLALLIELVRLRPLQFDIRIDDEEPKQSHGILAAIGNTRSYGGGIRICPDANPADGLLDVIQVGVLSRLRLLRLFPLLLNASHIHRPEVTTRRCTSISIEAPGLIVYADGERVGTESVQISMLPSALQVLVPKGIS